MQMQRKEAPVLCRQKPALTHFLSPRADCEMPSPWQTSRTFGMKFVQTAVLTKVLCWQTRQLKWIPTSIPSSFACRLRRQTSMADSHIKFTHWNLPQNLIGKLCLLIGIYHVVPFQIHISNMCGLTFCSPSESILILGIGICRLLILVECELCAAENHKYHQIHDWDSKVVQFFGLPIDESHHVFFTFLHNWNEIKFSFFCSVE